MAPHVMVVEPHTYHTSLLRMYAEFLPSLLGAADVRITYAVRGRRLAAVREFLPPGAAVIALGRGAFDVGPGTAVASWWVEHRLRALVRKHAPDVVVLNTLDDVTVQRAFRRLRVPHKIGLIHNGASAVPTWPATPGTLLACLHRYNFEDMSATEAFGAYFSPYFLPAVTRAPTVAGGPLRIAASGVISMPRRDYALLLDVAGRLHAAGGPAPVLFDIVGESADRDGPQLQREISARGLDDYFRMHTGLSDSSYYQLLCDADYVSDLVRPDAGPYQHGKVTLAYGNSGALGRPLLLHRDVADRIQLPPAAAAIYTTIDDLMAIVAAGPAAAEPRAQRYREYVATEIARNHDQLRSVPFRRET
jgi:hypothetical protein